MKNIPTLVAGRRIAPAVAAITLLAAAGTFTPRSDCAEGGDFSTDAEWYGSPCWGEFLGQTATVTLGDVIDGSFGTDDSAGPTAAFVVARVVYGSNYDNWSGWYPLFITAHDGGQDYQTGDMYVNLPLNAESVVIFGFGGRCPTTGITLDCAGAAFEHGNGAWYHDEPRMCIFNLRLFTNGCAFVNSTEWPFDSFDWEATIASGPPTPHVVSQITIDSVVPVSGSCGSQCYRYYVTGAGSTGPGTLSYQFFSGQDWSSTLSTNASQNFVAPAFWSGGCAIVTVTVSSSTGGYKHRDTAPWVCA